MRSEKAYYGWTEKRLTQGEAARLLVVCDRTFRRYINRYEENGLDGLIDLRLTQVSQKKRLGEASTVSAEIVRRYRG
jgi:transposase